MEQKIARDQDKANVCCPELLIVPCADTEEHCHLLCGFSKSILENETVKNQCIGDFSKCVLQGGD